MHTELITTYPTMAEVIAADREQLATWSRELADPDSDVQRAVRARIDRRLTSLTESDRHPATRSTEDAPQVEDSVAQVRALMGLLGDPSTFDRGFTLH